MIKRGEVMFFSTVGSDRKPDLDQMMSDYGDHVLRTCYLYLKDRQLAEDAVQDTFIKVYTKFHTFKGNSSEKTWIMRIAINVCKDYLRRRSYKELPRDFSEFVTADEGSEEPAAELINTDENIALLDAVTSLSTIYRETILLYYYNGFNTREIAKILKIGETTVCVRLKRARDMLRVALEEQDN